MRKLVIGLVLVVMAVFSLSAGTVEFHELKERHVDNTYEGHATVLLTSITLSNDIVLYYVEWWERGGSDVVSVYNCTSLEHAFNVWNMSRDKVESTRNLIMENVHTANRDNRLRLFRFYRIK